MGLPALLALAMPACVAASRVQTYEEYIHRRHITPYVLDLQSGSGRLVYVGTQHTTDPEDVQAALIKRLWGQTRPTVALHEGGDPPIASDAEQAVARFGEPGLVRFLADRDGVRNIGLEPDRADAAAYIAEQFDPELVTIFFVLRDYPFAMAGKRMVTADVPEFPEADTVLADLLAHFNSFEALAAGPATPDAFEAAVARRMPEIADWRGAPRSLFDPVQWPGRSYGQLNEVSRALSVYRDHHMVELLIRLVLEGETVFAVVGASHAVMQESMIRASLRPD